MKTAISALLLNAIIATNSHASTKVTIEVSDAFGINDGLDNIGIYDSTSVRGFDLAAAGNYRLNGTYFVKSSGISHFFVQSTTVHIGLGVAGMDFPGPSGVINFQLHNPKPDEQNQWRTGIEQFGTYFNEVHLKGASPDGRYSYSAGVALESNRSTAQGGTGHTTLIAGTARYVPNANSRWQWFAGEYAYERASSFMIKLSQQATALPSAIKRERYLGQSWAKETGQRRIAGVLQQQHLTKDWSLHSSLVFSEDDPNMTFTQLFTDVQPFGQAQSSYFVAGKQRFTAWSGESKLIRDWQQHGYRHRLAMAVRGRNSSNDYGGNILLNTGQVLLGEQPSEQPIPDWQSLRPQLHDEVRQYGLGLAYALQWPNQLQLSTGLMLQSYKKLLAAPTQPTESYDEQLLLPNFSLTYPMFDRWLLYSSYSKGLEESGIAPASTANPGQVLAAVQSKQKEFGIKGSVMKNLTLIASAFKTEKQFAGVDPASNMYQLIGQVSHQGAELSLTGALNSEWHWLAGGVYTTAKLDRTIQTALGDEPVGVPNLKLISHLLYNPSWSAGLQFDLNLDHVGRRAVGSRVMSDGKQLQAGSYTTVDLGFRYRVPALPALELRGQVFNVFDKFSWHVSSSESLTYIPGRSFRLRLHYNF
ncbi:MAG: TonB-dependent receptor [Idiomarina sp.]|nr:TonB-dependent receptor [Idiomarina sp.]